MGEVDNRRNVLESVFKSYDELECGELTADQLQRLHADLRIGGVSLPQVKASMMYVCIEDTCDLSELYDILQELDRRYFLVQDLRWEFSMLDRSQSNSISEDQAKWLMQAVHGKYFSNRKWENFLLSRLIPGEGMSFAEIEVMLCNIPSKHDAEMEISEAERSQQAKSKRQKEIEKLVQIEKENELREREKEKLRKGQQEKAKHNRQLNDEERLRREEAERKRKLQEEEEAASMAEADRLRELEEQQRQEDEKRKAEDDKLYSNVEQLAKEEAEKEKHAEKDLKDARQRKAKAEDARRKTEAESDEKDALQRKSDHKKKRIRYNLKVAIKARDKFQLQHSIKEFSDEKLEDDEMDLAKAQRLLKELTSRDNLQRAMSEREITELVAAMETVKKHGFEANLAKEMIAANKLLGRLRRLERIRHEILELKQATVAEIRSYQSPPAVVHTVMTCTFLLLGHPEKDTKNWKAVQALVGKTGKESLKRRCLGCDPGTLNPKETARAKTLLDKHELDEVRDVSAGAATFYVWAITMIEEAIEVAKQKEEEKLHPKQVETTPVKPMIAAGTNNASGGHRNSRQTGQRQSRSRSSGATGNRRSTSKTPERNIVQEKMNKVAAARRETDEAKRQQTE